jgi:hypothetical protein
VTPRWQEADEAVESLVAALVAAATKSADHSGHKGPRDRRRLKRQPTNTRRQIAEVIRRHRLAPGLRVDRNMIAALLIGHRDLVTNPVLVVAVAQACDIIAGRKPSAKKSARLRAASVRVGKLIARAQADTGPVPAPRVESVPSATPVLVEIEPLPAVEIEPRPSTGRSPSKVAPRRPRRKYGRYWWPAAAVLLLIVVALAAMLS